MAPRGGVASPPIRHNMETSSASKNKTSMMILFSSILLLISILGTLMASWTTLYALAYYYDHGKPDWVLLCGGLMLNFIVISYCSRSLKKRLISIGLMLSVAFANYFQFGDFGRALFHGILMLSALVISFWPGSLKKRLIFAELLCLAAWLFGPKTFDTEGALWLFAYAGVLASNVFSSRAPLLKQTHGLVCD